MTRRTIAGSFCRCASALARFGYPFGEFAVCAGLRLNGGFSPDRDILCRCGACRRGMDNVGFRTLGCGAAVDAGLGARPHECHSDHDLSGGDGAWGSDLGFGRRNNRSKLHIAWSGGPVPDEPASGPSAFDQLCGKSRRKGFRRFIYSCRVKRGGANSTHKRIARGLNDSRRCPNSACQPFTTACCVPCRILRIVVRCVRASNVETIRAWLGSPYRMFSQPGGREPNAQT
jgi:hypothetical protein